MPSRVSRRHFLSVPNGTVSPWLTLFSTVVCHLLTGIKEKQYLAVLILFVTVNPGHNLVASLAEE